MKSSKYKLRFDRAAREPHALLGVAAAVAVMAMPFSAWAAYVKVFGGPSYNEMTQTGFDSASLPVNPGSTVSNGGAAVGSASKMVGGQSLGSRAIRWDSSGAATELGHLGTNAIGGTTCEAYAVNAAGTAVGWAEKYTGGTGVRAVRWDGSGTAATELDPHFTGPDGWASSQALAINTGGTAVGYSYKNRNDGTRAIRWDASGTAATELDALGTQSSGITYSKAQAINTAGIAIGFADKYVDGTWFGTRAVRWDAGGSAVTELGNLGTLEIPVGMVPKGYTGTTANAINAVGITVGMADKWTGQTGVTRAVFWGLDGVAIDFNTLIAPDAGWTLYEARGISDTNWVSGVGGFDPDGDGPLNRYTRAFLLQVPAVIPEPTAGTLMIIAAFSLLRRSRRATRSLPPSQHEAALE
jgi:hypothetical protein